MMNIKNKVLAALALAVFVLPVMAFAQAIPASVLQAQIVALEAQLQTLEAQLQAQTGGSTWCYTFTTDLSVGMTGSGVTALQTALQKDGESVTVNGTFDDQTRRCRYWISAEIFKRCFDPIRPFEWHRLCRRSDESQTECPFRMQCHEAHANADLRLCGSAVGMRLCPRTFV